MSEEPQTPALDNEPKVQVSFWYWLKIISPLGHIHCKPKKNTKYSVVTDKNTHCLIVREHGLEKDSSPKPLYIVYPTYIVEYGDEVK